MDGFYGLIKGFESETLSLSQYWKHRGRKFGIVRAAVMNDKCVFYLQSQGCLFWNKHTAGGVSVAALNEPLNQLTFSFKSDSYQMSALTLVNTQGSSVQGGLALTLGSTNYQLLFDPLRWPKESHESHIIHSLYIFIDLWLKLTEECHICLLCWRMWMHISTLLLRWNKANHRICESTPLHAPLPCYVWESRSICATGGKIHKWDLNCVI